MIVCVEFEFVPLYGDIDSLRVLLQNLFQK